MQREKEGSIFVRQKKTTTTHSKHHKKHHLFPTKAPYKILIILLSLIAAAFMCMVIVVDAFPADLTLSMIAVMLAVLIFSCLLFASEKRYKRVLGLFLAIIYIAVFSVAGNFMGSTYAMFNKISDSGTKATGPAAKKVDICEETFNVYLTGIDQWASEKGLDLERSDVNMLVTINPQTHKILLTSIPRDTYVKLHTAQQMDKLTHTGIYGVEETLTTVEDWLGIDINYYAKMNYTAARDIIDAMGGIDIYSPVEFYSSIKGYHYKQGWNHLTGKRALFFARERKSFEGQDEVRVENQQRVLKAIIKKMTSSTTLLTKYGNIMDAAGDNLQTNFDTKDMKELVKMQLTDLAEWNVETQKIEGNPDQDYCASLSSKNRYDIFRPSDESVEACLKKIESVKIVPEEDMASLRNKHKSFFINAIKRIMKKEEEVADEQ